MWIHCFRVDFNNATNVIKKMFYLRNVVAISILTCRNSGSSIVCMYYCMYYCIYYCMYVCMYYVCTDRQTDTHTDRHNLDKSFSIRVT